METTNWFSCHVSFPTRDDPTSLPKSSFPTTKNGMCNLLSIVFHVFFAKQMTAQWWSQFFRTLFTYMYIYFTRPTKKNMDFRTCFDEIPKALRCSVKLGWGDQPREQQAAWRSTTFRNDGWWWLMNSSVVLYTVWADIVMWDVYA